MTTAQILAGDLTASLEDRVVSGLLLPYGEVGRTNLGRFSIDGPGIISIPNDVSVLMANENHSQTEPRARFLTATDTAAGIVSSFKIGQNPEGDALLARIDEGRKTGKPMALSVEVKNVVIQDGKAKGGQLTGAAFVDKGAFPSAALMAADTTEHNETEFTDENGVTWRRVEDVETSSETDPDTGVTKTTTVTTVTEEEEPADPATQEEEAAVPAATVPNTLAATATTEKKPMTLAQAFAAFDAIQTGKGNSDLFAKLQEESSQEATLFAALNDVKFDGAGGLAPTVTQPQWIGELWDGRAYQQKYLPLFTHDNLTGMTVNGFCWITKPEGGTWAGNKANVPTNSPAVAAYTKTASRFAGGHDHAREFRDFNVPGYWESYFRMMNESYAAWADEDIVLTEVLAGATTLEADNPAGLDIGAGLSALIDGAAAVIDEANALPTFAIVETALWKSILKVPNHDILGYMNASLGLEEGSLAGFQIKPSSALAAGNVLVGAREAVTVYELPGVPIRVEAPDMVKGGIDTDLFGYATTVIHKATALQLVTPYSAA